MPTTHETASELLAASDEQIERAVAHAEPMVLRGLLYQLTGDEQIAATRVMTDPSGLQTAMMVADEADVAMLRRKAVAFLRARRDAGAGPLEIGSRERLRQSIPLTLGGEIDDAEFALWLEELALDPWVRSVTWSDEERPDRLDGFSVTVIGAGVGGVNIALMLKRAGIPFQVFEKNSGVGGTWWETRYPGARLDTPSRGYTHIFGADYPYPSPFCTWEENQAYFQWVADTFELNQHTVFDTEVRALSWDEEAGEWEVEVEGPDGGYTVRSNAVFTAVGFLNRPKIPEIEGMADFRGASWHTSRWPEDADVRGKRVAVVGTGCTGYQLIPELARSTEHVVAFQRTPQWLFGVQGYLSPFPEEVGWLDRNLPYYTNYMRIRALSIGRAFGRLTEIDPDFDDPHTVSALNRISREASLAFLHDKVADPELRAIMTPAHPPWSARAVLVDSEYSVLDAIQRDDVTLVTSGVRRITETGIEDGDGTHHELDVIVYATGFHASEYLFPMTVTGREGQTLSDLWKVGGARAHRFCMYPGFPNLWSVYGPNTNGALVPASFHELVTRYGMECIERLLREDRRAIEPTREAYDRYNADVDERNARRVWSDPRASNYYWTEHGRSAVMCPFAIEEIFELLRHPPFDELEMR
ncbi:NAD(P)/FAD-dependent oxidoreductase [Conexibacter sp. CPCC 206217]|uniref:flavin-containing monooxygenase n=1 Tax=Conexibacter sp. CPCC 206217 TaxID=3064574 RepID=UPI00271661B2|nr:NAD(P)/FAD-dependent oxidoreductase [Conexibacter sp. CPCC 206217]MDO8211047.1 NAD(P)/FAD-dependent oxidoreductase [Conexibacter sp. CPCC 206217]